MSSRLSPTVTLTLPPDVLAALDRQAERLQAATHATRPNRSAVVSALVMAADAVWERREAAKRPAAKKRARTR